MGRDAKFYANDKANGSSDSLRVTDGATNSATADAAGSVALSG